MSIAEKLTTIVENEQKVYEAGKQSMQPQISELETEVEELKTLSINPNWTTWSYFSSNNNRNGLVSKLKYTDTSKGTDFSNMYYRCNDLKSAPEIDTSNGTNFYNMYYQCMSLSEIPTMNTSNGANFSGMFYGCIKVKTFPVIDTSNGTNFSSMYAQCYIMETAPEIDTSNGTNFSSMFIYCRELVTIPKINISKTTNTTVSMFNTETKKLENIIFEGTIPKSLDMRYCTLLTHDSLMSAINALYDYSADTSGTTYTLTIGKTNIAKLTTEELNIAESKGWVIA